jgi:hypothetical protein
VHIAGIPKLKLEVVSTTSPRSNLIGLLYDIAPDNKGTLVTRGAIAVKSAPEPQKLEFELYPNDYRVEAGHRLGLLIAGSDESWYTPPHSQATIQVKGGGLDLPLLRYDRAQFLEGTEAAAMANRPVADIEDDMGKATMTADFGAAPIPGGPPKSGGGVTSPPSGKPKGPQLRLTRKVRAGRRLDVKVRGAGTFPVTVTLKQGARTVFKKTVKPKKGVAQVVIKVRRKGTYELIAAAKGTGAPRAVRRKIRLK